MRNKFLFVFIFLSFILAISGVVNAQKAQIGKTSASAKSNAKKVSFNPGRRNPFLSKEEVIKIDQMKKAEQRRLAEEAAERERQAKLERERLLKQKILEDEIRRYPARAIMYQIRVDGILGKEAIVNGEVVGIGSKVLGDKVVSITDDSVWFTYKGQRFQRKLPLL